MARRDDLLPWGAFALASLIWGSTFLAIKLGNAETPPFWGATLRLAVAGAALGGIALAARTAFPRGAALRAALAFGALNMGLGLCLLYWGELTVVSGVAAVLFATAPLSTFAIAAMLGVERPTLVPVLGAVASVLGVAVVFAGELRAHVPVLGLLAILGAATSSSLAGVLVKRAGPQAVVPLNAVACGVGAAVALGVSVLAGESRALPRGWQEWWPILYLALAGSMGAYVLWTWLLRRWRASSASMIGVVVPVLAVLLGALVAGERPHALTFVGAAVVLAGVLVVLRAQAKPKERPAEAGAAPLPE